MIHHTSNLQVNWFLKMANSVNELLLGVVVILSGDYGADELGFEGEESSMSVSVFRNAAYSGSVWNE